MGTPTIIRLLEMVLRPGWSIREAILRTSKNGIKCCNVPTKAGINKRIRQQKFQHKLNPTINPPIRSTCESTVRPAEAARRQADLFLDSVSARLANARLTMINTSLTMQVTESFEELSFLHSMTTNLALDIHCDRLEEVVHMLLSRLCAIVRAEQMVLVLPPAAQSVLFEQQMLWARDELLDDQRLLELCQELKNKVVRSTVIENEFQTAEFATDYPEIRGLIGVVVGEDSDQGWLIAVKRAVPTVMDPVERSRSAH